ncbi:MFS transporter [Pseudohaliea rubra]|uniref:Sugar transporter n=1 Tax=Pseudohaliea rubra DSM 19751 TaxID=1265313 RepID=A0A095VU02_9GAMM|nr:MFS transporter [Pseudohaliea rubra]KGE04850.1 Sugar transporter [Pseudohaliea rubra DSM 19751]
MTAQDPASPPRLGLLAAYGSLAFPLAAGFIALQVIVPTYYAQVLGLSLSAVGGILLVARLWDLVTDPLVGFLSDRTPARFGRRRLWIGASAPLLAIAAWYLFNPAPGVGNGYLFWGAIAIYIAGTFAVVPMNAWGAELSADYHQRARITGARTLFGLLGTLAGLLLIDNTDNDTLGASLRAIALLLIIGLALAVPWALWRVPDRAVVTGGGNNLRGAWALLRQRSPFRRLLLAFLVNGTANAIPATLFLLYVTQVLERPGLAGPVLFLYFAASALSIPAWVALARRIGKHQAWCVAVVGSCLFFAGAPFLGPGDTAWYVAIVAGTGLMVGADLSLPSAINGDLIEWDEWENGQRRPGLFFALWGTASKLAFALAVGTIFPLLDLVGFSAQGGNTDQAVRLLAVLYAGPSIALKLVAVAMMARFPINEAVHSDLRRRLEARRAGESAGDAAPAR